MAKSEDLVSPELEERFRSEIVVWLTTVSPDGRPQSVPVWFSWDGEWFRIYSRPRNPKLRNIASNPKVGLHLRGTETGEEIVVVEGVAEIAPDLPPADREPAYVEKYRTHIESLGYTPESMAGAYSEPIRIRPTAVREW